MNEPRCLVGSDDPDDPPCHCEKLAFPFSGDRKAIWQFDHLSDWALRLSRWIWIEDSASCTVRPVSVPIGDGRWLAPVESSDFALQCPFPLEGGHFSVTMVIRQWVEEEPSQKLATILRESHSWQALIQDIKERWSDLEGWLCRPIPEFADRRDWCAADFRGFLERNGFPGTPGMASFLLRELSRIYEIEHLAPPLTGPTRGALVTSIVLCPNSESDHVEGQIVSSITSVYPWTTNEIRKQASAVVDEHAAWWRAIGGQIVNVPQVILRKLNGRQKDALAQLVDRYIAGEIPRKAVDDAALKAERDVLGRALTMQERSAVLHRVSARVYEARSATD